MRLATQTEMGAVLQRDDAGSAANAMQVHRKNEGEAISTRHSSGAKESLLRSAS